MPREIRNSCARYVKIDLIGSYRIDLRVYEIGVINCPVRPSRIQMKSTARKDHALQEPISVGDSIGQLIIWSVVSDALDDNASACLSAHLHCRYDDQFGQKKENRDFCITEGPHDFAPVKWMARS